MVWDRHRWKLIKMDEIRCLDIISLYDIKEEDMHNGFDKMS